MGKALRIMKNRLMPSTGITTTKMNASLPPMIKAMMMAKVSIKGLRMAVRMIII